MNKRDKTLLTIAVIMVAGILAPFPLTTLPAAFICMCLSDTL